MASESITVAPVVGDEVMVDVCGHACVVKAGSPPTLSEMQSQIQAQLQMDGQMFDFFDTDGTLLLTDAQVQETICQCRVPLKANLTDASMHYIENRREELAQMQWKLIRDQMAGATQKAANLAREVQTLSATVDQYRKDHEVLAEKVRPMLIAAESERNLVQNELRQYGERMNSFVQVINVEKNKREVSMQNWEKQIQALRDAIDTERSQRKQDLATHQSMATEIRNQMKTETLAREALEDKFMNDVHAINDRIDANSAHQAHLVADQMNAFKKVADEHSSEVQTYARAVLNQKNEHETTMSEARSRFIDLEDRCTSLEARIADIVTRQSQGMDKMWERHEKIVQAVGQLRLEEKCRDEQVQQTIERVKDEIESSLKATEDEVRETSRKERTMRDDQIRRASATLKSNQFRHFSEIEQHIAERLERESAERERSVSQILGEVNKTMETMPIPIKDGATSNAQQQDSRSALGQTMELSSHQATVVGPGAVVEDAMITRPGSVPVPAGSVIGGSHSGSAAASAVGIQIATTYGSSLQVRPGGSPLHSSAGVMPTPMPAQTPGVPVNPPIVSPMPQRFRSAQGTLPTRHSIGAPVITTSYGGTTTPGGTTPRQSGTLIYGR
eukprot:gnl/TRDRNA2_/TRDRNA2_194575_c0_seq1.p1 gnl/TRDRNA2_/TRDRNA2_194575_c0~~gnl/TRDRNA2_/TRDRNA2_194575_c0_seq1.p1  ORF type:complete len:647 (-),score=123.45 gnl/TRDRNA2_/TRDRNA2_194575_c0_seq1:57-1910(-)